MNLRLRRLAPRPYVIPLFVIAVFLLLTCRSGAVSVSTAPPEYTLVWSDEFSDQAGTSRPDPKKWVFDIGGNGWGNQELEYYTNRSQNAVLQEGNLVITARRETYTGAEGTTRDYTSARLRTQGLFSQAYGRFEARAKIPSGQGLWPAFWMLGNNITSVGWPKCGEIDIMENIGKQPGVIYGSLHGPSLKSRTTTDFGIFKLPAGEKFADEFHVYAIEWEPGTVRFYVDSHLYGTFTKSGWPSTGPWVFDHPFFIILNVAVGGDWPGPPDSSTSFPQQMLVDYVRVYDKK